jgi:hypothetical protein
MQNVGNPGIFETTLENFDNAGTKFGSIEDYIYQAMEWVSGNEIYVSIWRDEEAMGGSFWGTTYFGKIDRKNGLTIIKNWSDECDAMSLAWNPTTETMYATTLWSELATVDVKTGEFTIIVDELYEVPGNSWWGLYSIAIDNNGICYALEWTDTESGRDKARFGTMDLTTGAFTPIVDAPEDAFYFQSLEIDRQTNELYWQAHFVDISETNFFKIDKTTGDFTLLGQVSQRFNAFAITGPNSDETSITETNLNDLHNPLEAWVRDGKIHITGLIIGERLNIYNINGQLVYQGIANSNEMSVTLNVHGTYIIQSGQRVVKVVF